MKARYILVPIIAFSLLAAGCGMKDDANNEVQGVEVGGAMMMPSMNIVDNAMKANNVTTLVAAVSAADLAETLKGPGPFTVFAPTNSAFEKLPAGTVDTLLKPENKDMLTNILTYHVVAGRFMAKDLQDGQMLTTVQGQMLKVTKNGNSVKINGSAMIETADVISSNGITHVIDSVLMPQEGVMVGGAMMVPNLDIVDNAVNASNVTTLVAAVKAAGLVDTLKGAGPFTVFAPTNDAFAKLPAGTVDTLLKPENKAMLSNVLTYHVVAGRYQAKDLKDGMMLKSVQGQMLTIGNKNGQLTVNGMAMVQTKDVISKNGVTFVIDSVLMPK